jgi:hypothetical protein
LRTTSKKLVAAKLAKTIAQIHKIIPKSELSLRISAKYDNIATGNIQYPKTDTVLYKLIISF